MSWISQAPLLSNGSEPPLDLSAPVRADSEPTIVKLAEWHSADDHADRLVRHLMADGHLSGAVLSHDLKRVHIQLCADLNWMYRPWQPVASSLRKLAGGRKTYAWVGKSRLRVFALEKLVAGVLARLNVTKHTGDDDAC